MPYRDDDGTEAPWYTDRSRNTVEENASIFSLIQMLLVAIILA